MELYGDWNSEKARKISVILEKCTGEMHCKSEEEIDEFMRGKYLLLLNNQIRFDSKEYHEDSIKLESRIRWITISTKM